MLALEWVGFKIVEMTIFPAVLQSPYILYVFALLVLSTVLIWGGDFVLDKPN